MVRNHIDRRKLLKSIGTVGLAGATLSTSGIAAAKSAAPVKKNEARKIAQSAVEAIGKRDEFKKWGSEGVKSPELFYTRVQNGEYIKHMPRSWIFPIENRGENVGYINISARNEQTVLGYGASKAPQRKLTEAKRKTPANSKSLSGRFIYHGGVEFLIESTDVDTVDLRSGKPKECRSIDDINEITTTENEPSSGEKEQTDQEDWSGSLTDEVHGVPNWTSEDSGGESSTDIGSGPDSWDEWDGCIPIAASMVIGYHEGLNDRDDDAREALIDRLHNLMDTGEGDLCSYCTSWDDMPSGIENYSHGSNSYYSSNIHNSLKRAVRPQIADENPVILNMSNGPYTVEDEGHSVCVIGYRDESCGFLCNDMYYKVHNTYGDYPDLVTHGAWQNACITTVSVS